MSRYSKGMGRLDRRTVSGQKVGSFFFKYDGRRISTGTQDRAEAEEFRRRHLGKADRIAAAGQFHRKVKCDELLDLVREEYQQRRDAAQTERMRQNKQTSLEHLESRIRCRLGPYFGDLQAGDVRRPQIKRFIAMRDEQGVAIATVNREVETLRRAFRLGVREELIEVSPSFEGLVRQTNNERQGFLEFEHYERLRDAFDDPAVRLMFVIGFHIGWRADAIRWLEWEQIDLEQGLILPPYEQAENKWVGEAPIYGDLKRALLEASFVRERDWPQCPWVIQRGGERLKEYRYAWKRAKERAGLNALLFHDLRRTARRSLREAGLDRLQIKLILGHKTDAMSDRYDVRNIKDTQLAGEQLGRYWNERADAKQASLVQ